MMESIINLMTKDNITLAIAIIGFVLSLYTWICTLIERKRNITIEIDNQAQWAVRFTTSKCQCWTTAVFINNKSHLQNSIHRISVLDEQGKEYFAQIPQQFVAHTFRKLIDTDTKWFEKIIESAKFPIDLNTLGSAYEYIEFQLPIDFNHTPQAFILYTNRGKIKHKLIDYKMPPLLQESNIVSVARNQSCNVVSE